MPAAVPVSAGPTAVLDHVGVGTDLIVPLANGEPVTLLDAVEAAAEEWQGVRVHQMHALHDRPYLHGAFGDRLRHVSYFLSHATRPCFHDGTIDLVPNHFSEMRTILRDRTVDPLVLAAASPPDRHGYFSLVSVPTTWRPSSAGPASSSRPTGRCRGRSDATRCT
jgi:acyl-CoA hydrolase